MIIHYIYSSMLSNTVILITSEIFINWNILNYGINEYNGYYNYDFPKGLLEICVLTQNDLYYVLKNKPKQVPKSNFYFTCVKAKTLFGKNHQKLTYQVVNSDYHLGKETKCNEILVLL